MKTAISIPDEIYEAAEAAAERLGVSRSKLYATAVAEYVAQYGTEGVTDRLDEIYANRPSKLDPPLQRMQRSSVTEEEW